MQKKEKKKRGSSFVPKEGKKKRARYYCLFKEKSGYCNVFSSMLIACPVPAGLKTYRDCPTRKHMDRNRRKGIYSLRRKDIRHEQVQPQGRPKTGGSLVLG